MKKNYETPLSEVISLDHRDPVLDGGSPFRDAGSGAHDVNVSQDDDLTIWM